MINNHTCLNSILYADDQIIIPKNEDNLQRSVHVFNKLTSDLIFTVKTEVFYHIRSKIVLENSVTQKNTSVSYLDYDVI